MSQPKTKDRLKWYNFNKILSLNAMIHFIVGPRGNGKTYGAKKKAIKDAITKKRQFIYVRRYKEELGLAREAFFDDIVANDEFPEWDFRVQGRVAQMAHAETRDAKKRPWIDIGYFVALSSGQSYKSVPFPNVWTIIYDEFILEKSATHYLPNEPDLFMNFLNTVDRSKDQVRVFFLANAVSIMNPYFLEYDIKPGEMGEMGRMGLLDDGTYYVAYHFIHDETFIEQVSATKFGQFIKQTEYGKYAIMSEFSDNHQELIGTKPPEARYVMTIESKDGEFSLWRGRDERGVLTFWAQSWLPKQQDRYTLALDRVTDEKAYLPYGDKRSQMLRQYYNSGRIRFDLAQTRNMFIHIFKR